MSIGQLEAWIFLPFVVPICVYVAFMDMREMRIPNPSVLALAGVFALLGLFVLPLDTYLWRLLQLLIMLVAGFLFSLARLMGEGDAKFIAAAAPYVVLQDLGKLALLFSAILLASYGGHFLAKRSALRRLVPNWTSWTHAQFPMGLALGGTLAAYLIARALTGS
jgi:prepilin peptidase CpaA